MDPNDMEVLPIRNNLAITDLGFDCLEKCLRHLSIEDLLNVADSNAVLKDVARYVFREKCQREPALGRISFKETIRFRKENHRCECGRFDLTAGCLLFIHELKFCLQFLRCFGDFVTDMTFGYSIEQSSSGNCQFPLNHQIQCDEAQQWQYNIVNDYVNEFCADSLRRLVFYKHYFDYVHWGMGKLIKPFKNVETIVGSVCFNTQLKLHEIFPKVRSIAMGWPDSVLVDEHLFVHNHSIANCFPYLQDLWVYIDDRQKYNRDNFAIALRLNNKIKTLSGNVWFDVLFDPNNFRLWNSAEHFNNLESLYLEVNLLKNRHFIDILKTPVSEELHLKNLKELNITFINGTACNEDVWNFPFICDNLQSLTITDAIECRFNRFSNLLNKHPTVKRFKFGCNRGELNMDDCVSIAKAFPLLEEIVFETITENVVRAVEMFRFLKYFECYVRHSRLPSDTDHLERSLNGWSVSSKLSSTVGGGFERLVQGRR